MVPEQSSQTIDIQGLSCDSRKIAPGYLFAALPGQRTDGRKYIDSAVRRGAAAVLAPRETALKEYGRPLALLTDDNPRRQFALMAARFYGRQPRVVAAVTGTNGKTSVSEFTRQIWQQLDHKAASLGTLGVIPAHEETPGSLTTPDPVDLHRCLAALAEDGFEHLAMEASSHGLEQYRLDGVTVEAAAFTNLSRDHLDYHGSMPDYLAAKLRLFRELLSPQGQAVINADAPEARVIEGIVADRRLSSLSYGRAGRDLRLIDARPTAEGQHLRFEVLGRKHEAALPLAGAFQGANVLAALGLAIATGADPEAAVATLGGLQGVRGRMELVARTPEGASVYVDYSHTPDALENALRALRPHTERRLSVVFGCGGDRDPGKRPIMGQIAKRWADDIIVTDDNPRSEDPAAIRQEILAAVPEAREVGDRGQAIAVAVAALGPGDVLVVAGKGHEVGQTIGGMVLPFDDRDVARASVARHFGEVR